MMTTHQRSDPTRSGKMLLRASVPRCVVVALVLAVVPLSAQTPPAFEAASVKPNRSATPGMEIRVTPDGSFVATNAPVRALIRDAYRVRDYQMIDVPGWVDSDRFDVIARTSQGTTPEQLQPMLQALLKERFGLAARHESREMPVYEVSVARADGRLGSRLQPAAGATAAYCASQRLPVASRPAADPSMRRCGMLASLGSISGGDVALAPLFTFLSQQVGRSVLDRTALSGTFDFDLRWTPDQFAGRQGGPDGTISFNGSSIDPNGPTLFTALQEQLGLKVDSQRGAVDVLVVERIERPTED